MQLHRDTKAVGSFLVMLAFLLPSIGVAQQSRGPMETRSATAAQGPVLVLIEPYWEGIEGQADRTALEAAWRSSLDLVTADLAGRASLLVTDVMMKGAPASGPRIRASLTGSPGSWSAVLSLEGEPVQGDVQTEASRQPAMRYFSFAEVGPAMVLQLARGIESLARRLDGATRPAPTATLVDSFSPQDLLGVDLPLQASNLVPMALAERKDGRLVVACGSAILELDRAWKVGAIPGKALAEAGEYSFAYGLALTPAGTLFVRNADGSGIVALAEGQDGARRLRIDSPPGAAFGVTASGAPFAFAVQPRLARIWEGRTARDLGLPASAMVYAASAGPEDTLWLSDLSSSSILVLSTDGLLRDVLYPELPAGQQVMRLRVLADGSFLAATSYGIARLDRQGRLLWTWDGRAEGLALSFSTMTDLATSGDGIVYVNDYSGRRVLRLAEPGTTLPADLSRVAAATRAVLDARRGAAPAATEAPALLALADAYAAMGATEAERASLARYLEAKPADAGAADRELRLESELVALRAGAAAADAKALIARFGPETGRPAWTRAMRDLETLRSLSPDDRKISADMAALRKLLRDAEGTAETGQAPLPEVKATELAALFPSMLQAYRARPAGSVTVKNGVGEPLRNLRADLFIPKYMDFPSEGKTLARLEAGAEAKLELSALLNDRVLEVEEDLPLQALVTIRFTDSRGNRSMEYTRPLTLYRRTALTWAETGRLASFVTPNEDTVARSAFAMLQDLPAASLVSPVLQRAAAICASVGALPLRYVQDPDTAFSAVSGDGAVVDTVRFPRTTLAYRAGDCDDSTALLASLLEAAAIPTAILTSPGHVFLAFDSGEKADSAWLFDAPGFATIPSGGKLWIPIESTALSNGLTASWKAASELVTKYRGTKDFEFLPLASLRPTFPALPLPPSPLPVPLADHASRDGLVKAGDAGLGREVYGPVAARLEKARAAASGAEWDKASNRLAQAHARYGRTDLATSTLRDTVKRDPGYAPAWINLATLGLLAGDRDGALAVLRQAALAAPGSTALGDFAKRAGLSDALSAGGVRLTFSTPTAGAATETTRASGGKELGWEE